MAPLPLPGPESVARASAERFGESDNAAARAPGDFDLAGRHLPRLRTTAYSGEA